MSYILSREVLDSNDDVFSLVVNGETVFVKKKRPPENRLCVFIQDVLFRLTGNPLLLPAYPPSSGSAVFEAQTMQALGRLGVPVPKVLHAEEDYFVMSFAGEHLEWMASQDPMNREKLILDGMKALRQLHRMGYAHGAAEARNLTVLDTRIYFIDFEVDIPENRVPEFQLRDIFLYLFSLERQGYHLDLYTLFSCYDEDGSLKTFAHMQKLLKSLKWVLFMESSLFKGYRMTDVRCLCRLIRKFTDHPMIVSV